MVKRKSNIPRITIYAVIHQDEEDGSILNTWGAFPNKKAAKQRAEQDNLEYFREVMEEDGETISDYQPLEWDQDDQANNGNIYSVIKLRI